MKSGLFRKYFAVCSLCVLASIAVLGAILMVFASRFYVKDKYALIERSAMQASNITAQTYELKRPGVGEFNGSVLRLIYSSLSTALDGGVWLTDKNGKVIYSWYTEENTELNFTTEELQNLQIAPLAVQKALQGKYHENGTLGGLYKERQYIVGVPVRVTVLNAVTRESYQEDMAVLFVATPAGAVGEFLASLLQMFLISAVVVLFIAFILIYFITSRLVRPLKEMLAATNSFTKGDFSVRVPVGGYDELGQLSMAFNNMASTLATTEHSRRSFVANVSHELKTPMTTISGFVDGILDGTVPEEKRDQYLQVVSSEVKRLSRLVHSMLDTARIEAGEMSIHPTCFDISELCRQTIFSFEQRITDKNLEVEGLEIDKVMVYADQDLMNQVVYNLIENAVKFVNEGGTISVAYWSDNTMTYIAIRNTGEGLENEEIPRLFDRFYKSDKSRSLNKNGVGLGLHIVRSIINYHNGEVVVRSAEGEYTEFEIALPNPPQKKLKEKEKGKVKTKETETEMEEEIENQCPPPPASG